MPGGCHDHPFRTARRHHAGGHHPVFAVSAPPPEVLDSPFGKFIPFGPPFRLDLLAIIPLPVTDPVDPPIEDVSDISDAMVFSAGPPTS